MKDVLILSGSARKNGETSRIVSKFAVDVKKEGCKVDFMGWNNLGTICLRAR